MAERVVSGRDKRTADSVSNDEAPGFVSTIARAPFNLLFSILSGSLSAVRPYAPRIIPLLVCSFFIPLIIFLSASAGWVVWSNLSVSWEVPLYLQYGDGIPPYAYTQLPRLSPQQKYDISVHLTLPFTNSNLMLGNFMTSLTISTLSNKTISYARRPAIALPPQSSFFCTKPRSTHIKVPLLESFVARTANVAANVEVGRRDGWTTLGAGQGREVSIVYASVRGLAVPHGIRGIAIRFPLLSSLAAAAVFLLILSLMLGTCVLPLLLPSAPEPEGSDEQEDKVETKRRISSASQRSADDGDGRRGRRSRSNKSQERTVKPEAPVQTIPPADDSSRGLRRRSSKPVIGTSEAEI